MRPTSSQLPAQVDNSWRPPVVTPAQFAPFPAAGCPSSSRGSLAPGERVGARLVDPLGVALPFALAQHELLDLARGRLRQVAKFDDLGALEVGQPTPTVGDDGLGGGGLGRLLGHENPWDLPPL